MIRGAHMILYSAAPEADRAFLRDVLQLTHVDAGDGWLIFGLPPCEVAVHPAEVSGKQELYFLTEAIEGFVERMNGAGVACSAVEDHGWGLLVTITLPGGGRVGVYQPRHPRPGD
jgi:hypothetical protein